MRTLTYYVGVTLDGFIAAPDGSTDFFPVAPDVAEFLVGEYPEALPTHVRARLGVDPPNRRFDTVVMGRGTYQPALDEGITSPYQHLHQHVVSRTIPSDVDPAVTVVAGDPVAAVRRLKAQEGLGIWLAGGGRLAGSLLEEVDVLVLKRYPVLAGAGIPAVAATFSPRAFTHQETRTFSEGTTVSTFTRSRGRTDDR